MFHLSVMFEFSGIAHSPFSRASWDDVARKFLYGRAISLAVSCSRRNDAPGSLRRWRSIDARWKRKESLWSLLFTVLLTKWPFLWPRY